MYLLAATATDSQSSAGSLFLFALFVGACYVGACVIWPFRACRGCGGTGRLHSHSGRAWRPCKRCGGSGAKLRAGRRVYAHLRDTRDRDRTRRRTR
jgi:hypothetical protein